MDLTKLIKEKSKAFSNTEHLPGIESVIGHIEIAERHLNQGKKGDDYLFNDVIYRTNQAFEGSLKEAYNVLTGSKSDKKSPHEIEKYLESNNLLKERVLSLFSNYRREWRNKSTHDYKLYFSEQEAFLAIVNISAFFNILLDQMVEKVAYDYETQTATKAKRGLPQGYSSFEFSRQVCELLLAFAKEVPAKSQWAAMPRLFEREVAGMLAGFINTIDPQIEVLPEFSIMLGSNRRLMADFVLKKGDKTVIIEMKMPGSHVERRRRDGREQLFSYMAASNIDNGILFIPPISTSQQMVVESQSREIANMQQNIVEVFPRGRA